MEEKKIWWQKLYQLLIKISNGEITILMSKKYLCVSDHSHLLMLGQNSCRSAIKILFLLISTFNLCNKQPTYNRSSISTTSNQTRIRAQCYLSILDLLLILKKLRRLTFLHQIHKITLQRGRVFILQDRRIKS